MGRVEFTKKIAELIIRMIAGGEEVILDYVKRSPQEQNRLFKAGLSKCDGYKVRSKHEEGKAADIYFLDKKDKSKLSEDVKLYKKWHKVWESMGGRPMIKWDLGHYEVE